MKLLTGGLGFVGRSLAARLREVGARVRILDRRVPDKRLPPECEFIQGDVSDLALVREACQGTESVVNLVSLLPCSRAGRDFWRVNVDGTANVLQASLESGVRKVIHISSSIVYGIPSEVPLREECRARPVGGYGRSKLAAEDHCRAYMTRGLRVTVLRPRFIVGPGRLGLLTILFDWVRRGRNIYTIGNGHNRFQMLAVSDLLEACLLAELRGDNETFNLGADGVPTVQELLLDLVHHAGTGSRVVSLRASLARTTLRLLDLLRLTPLGTEHYLIADKEYVLDTTKAQQIIGWHPREGMMEAMRAAYDWYCENRDKLSRESEQDFPREGLLKLLRALS